MSFDLWSVQDSFVGFDSLFDDLSRSINSKPRSYPPYNLRKNENNYIIEVAVAGFDKDEITIREDHHEGKRILKIESNVKNQWSKKNSENKEELLHNGIARRKFQLFFHLNENIQIVDVHLENGILTVNLKDVPDEKSSKVYDIK